jgi:hypothetical protein
MTADCGTDRIRLPLVLAFGLAMGYFEATIVVYLRELFYPEGFSFPLALIPRDLLVIEILREFASIIMVATVAGLAGRKFWERFAYFIIIFGVWDIFYYVFLRLTIGWPMSLLDWDILYLIPLPWIGPVIAPVLISLLMIITGVLMVGLAGRGYDLKPTPPVWILAVGGTVVLLFSFMRDTAATLHQQMPQPYSYWLLAAGLVLYLRALLLFYSDTKKAAQPQP